MSEFTDFQLTESDIDPLVGMLGNRVTQWRQICGQCGVIPSDVDLIAKNPLYLLGNYQSDCCTAGLKKWCTDAKNKAMFSVFIKAMRSRVVGEGALANEIISKRHELPSGKASANGHQNLEETEEQDNGAVNTKESEEDRQLRKGLEARREALKN